MPCPPLSPPAEGEMAGEECHAGHAINHTGHYELTYCTNMGILTLGGTQVAYSHTTARQDCGSES
jgi:hypothetical protein